MKLDVLEWGDDDQGGEQSDLECEGSEIEEDGGEHENSKKPEVETSYGFGN